VGDPNINALIIYASPADYQTILSALRKIDIAPLQVLIEATIAEVTLTGSFEYGLQWFFRGLEANANVEGSRIFDIIGEGLTGWEGTFTYGIATQNVRVALTALSQQTDVRIISSPQIMVRDNQPARIQIGDQVPVLTQQAVSTITPGAPVVNSVQYIDAGVILEVTPHVNANGLVSLDIAQQISTPVRTETSDIDSPSIQQRMIETSVAVQSGNVVALGGLIADRESKGGTGLPALRRIPESPFWAASSAQKEETHSVPNYLCSLPPESFGIRKMHKSSLTNSVPACARSFPWARRFNSWSSPSEGAISQFLAGHQAQSCKRNRSFLALLRPEDGDR
jgi:general secretion pathway protein D